jgi:hypothetical protein
LVEDHHDVELVDQDGRRLARVRLPEGLEGVARLYELIAARLPASWAELEPVEVAGRVRIGIETDRGGLIQAPGQERDCPSPPGCVPA